jgi:nicotinamide mononucleotide transporter PnuC
MLKKYAARIANWKKAVNFDNVLGLLTLIGIIVGGIYTKQMFIKLLPCCVSVAVQFLAANANRYAFLLGAANSVIYSVGYFLEGLYGSTAQAIIQGVILQLVIYYHWKKNAEGRTVQLKKLPFAADLLTGGIIAGLSAALSVLLSAIGGNNSFLDALILFSALAISALSFSGYIDQWYFSTVFGIAGAVLWSVKFSADGKALTYLIYFVYYNIKVVEGVFKWKRIYKKQSVKI